MQEVQQLVFKTVILGNQKKKITKQYNCFEIYKAFAVLLYMNEIPRGIFCV